jgi:DNA-binding CsgD family transcriptional regulator
MDMDWESTIAHLAQTGRPSLIVDSGCRLRHVNAAAEKLLGRGFDDLSSSPWMATCVPSSAWSKVRDIVRAGLRGAATSADIPLIARSGEHLTMRADLAIANGGSRKLLVITARDVSDGGAQPVLNCDCACEVTRDPGHASILRAVRFLDPARDGSAYVGRPLGDLLTDLACGPIDAASLQPVLEGSAPAATNVGLSKADDAFRVVSAAALDEGTVQVKVRCVPASLLPALVDAKAAHVGEASALSERERQVLGLLLRGRGVEDIATMLQIAPRTVKFHQANVLEKLGADSRLDLLRVVI